MSDDPEREPQPVIASPPSRLQEGGASYSRPAIDLARAYQRALIQSRTRAAMHAKKSRGERLGTVPYGYRLAADRIHLELDEAEQIIIANVKELALAGLSQRAIVVKLADRGVVGRKGVPLQRTQVARILVRRAS